MPNRPDDIRGEHESTIVDAGDGDGVGHI